MCARSDDFLLTSHPAVSSCRVSNRATMRTQDEARLWTASGEDVGVIAGEEDGEEGLDDEREQGGRFESRQRARQAWIEATMGRDVDVVTLGNLMVDVVLHVDTLPPSKGIPRKDYMARLSVSPPGEDHWEAGGNSNFAIAASRIGLDCVTVGHVGDEMFGHFLEKVLHKERVGLIGLESHLAEDLGDEDYDGETLLCWVLIDPNRRHSFCSRFDFSKTPVFSKVRNLPLPAQNLIRRSKGLFVNGFAFDEFEPGVVLEVVEFARSTGTAVFFDPGPRGKMMMGDKEGGKRLTLEKMLRRSTVLLLTSDEAEAITGVCDPLQAGKALLERGGGELEWVVVKRGSKGCVLSTREKTYVLEGIKVEVVDTVGCGDSFAAAIVLGYIRGEKLSTTLALANAVGAATAMGRGAGRNVARASQIVELLSNARRRRGHDSSALLRNGMVVGAEEEEEEEEQQKAREKEVIGMIDWMKEYLVAKEEGRLGQQTTSRFSESTAEPCVADADAVAGHATVNGVGGEVMVGAASLAAAAAADGDEGRTVLPGTLDEVRRNGRAGGAGEADLSAATRPSANEAEAAFSVGIPAVREKLENRVRVLSGTVTVSLEDTAVDAINLLKRSLKISIQR